MRMTRSSSRRSSHRAKAGLISMSTSMSAVYSRPAPTTVKAIRMDGVCLYLAFMKRLFGDRFTIALLDDVVMSVDSGHRYQFCKLLKTQFPDTQLIITTYDRLWAEQMRSAGLVTAKTSLAFHGWTVDTGPLVKTNAGIWEEIAAPCEGEG